MLTRDELAPPQIEDLRGRLERGELADRPPVQLQPWARITEVERFVRATLQQVDSWKTAPLERQVIPGAVRMQQTLAEDLSLLYERLVEGKPCPPITYRTQR